MFPHNNFYHSGAMGMERGTTVLGTMVNSSMVKEKGGFSRQFLPEV